MLISPSRVAELHAIEATTTPGEGVFIGGAAPLSAVEVALAEFDERRGRGRGQGGGDGGGGEGAAAACVDMLRWFASTQIRNVACLAGDDIRRRRFIPWLLLLVLPWSIQTPVF